MLKERKAFSRHNILQMAEGLPFPVVLFIPALLRNLSPPQVWIEKQSSGRFAELHIALQ
jgi:hypothetical protein